MSLPLTVSSSDIDEERLITELKHWVSIETHTPDGGAVNRLADHVEASAKTAGLATRRIPGENGFGDTLTVQHGGNGDASEKGILVLAHLDTVHAAGTIEGRLPWREEGNQIFGPGVYDMKSGALMALEALKAAIGKGNGPKLPVTIMFVPDEEMGSKTSRGHIEAAAGRSRYALVVEPAREGGKIVVARKGVAMYDIVVRGRAAHAGSRPQDGRSAIREAARIVLELEALNDPGRGVTVTVGMIDGGTGRNTIPAECRLYVDARVPDVSTGEEILGRIERIEASGPDFTVEISGGLNRPAFAQSDDGKALFAQAAALAAPLGIGLEGMITGGGSDGNFTAALGVATLDGLGADGAGAHTFDEHIFRDSVAPRTALLANLMLTLDAGR